MTAKRQSRGSHHDFEAFETAIALETFSHGVVAADLLALVGREGAEPAAGTLRAALLGAGASSPRPAILAESNAAPELFVQDLWIGRGGSEALRSFERPEQARATGAGWHGLLAASGDFAWLPGGEGAELDAAPAKTAGPVSAFYSSDGGGDDQTEEEEEQEIFVTGRRPRAVDDDSGYEGDPGSDVGGDGDGGGEGGIGGGDLPGEEQNDCRDRKALEAQTEIKAHNDDSQREHGVLIYRGADGQVYKSSVLHGNPDSIPRDVFTNWMNQNGVSFSQVIGFVHNHDAWQYATSNDEAAVNRYPSGNDWNAAAWMVSNGAGGQNGTAFALYVMDTTGDMHGAAGDQVRRASWWMATEASPARSQKRIGVDVHGHPDAAGPLQGAEPVADNVLHRDGAGGVDEQAEAVAAAQHRERGGGGAGVAD